jgi:hypothetical protein
MRTHPFRPRRRRAGQPHQDRDQCNQHRQHHRRRGAEPGSAAPPQSGRWPRCGFLGDRELHQRRPGHRRIGRLGGDRSRMAIPQTKAAAARVPPRSADCILADSPDPRISPREQAVGACADSGGCVAPEGRPSLARGFNPWRMAVCIVPEAPEGRPSYRPPLRGFLTMRPYPTQGFHPWLTTAAPSGLRQGNRPTPRINSRTTARPPKIHTLTEEP